jgi:hypothetical protein
MKCYLCKRGGNIKLQKGRDICSDCFVRLIEKRVRKYVRLNKLFKRNDGLVVKDAIDRYFISNLDLPVNFVKKGKKVVLWSMDDEVNEFVSGLFSGKKVKKTKDIRLLKVVTDKELLLFAKIKGLKFKANKKNNDVQKFLDAIEKKHGNIKYNLLKNIEELKKI